LLKFFRKIRQRLLTENKTSQYLKYAIGEIVLVVIGIFIALQINNCNSSKNDDYKGNEYLNNIRRDLKEQVIDIDIQLDFESKQLTNTQSILTVLDNNSSLTDSILKNLTMLSSRRTFVPVDPTFQDLKSTGNLNLIRNDSRRDNLIKYYQVLTLEASIIAKNNTSLIDELFNQNMM
jgi:hypothetical protein